MTAGLPSFVIPAEAERRAGIAVQDVAPRLA